MNFSSANLPAPVALDRHDALFASRTTPEDWARILAFRNQPGFLDGARRHEGVMSPFFSNNLILNKVVLEAWRFRMIVFTLYLHNTRDPGDPRTGLTLTNLSRVCREHKLASNGRVYAFLNLMKLGKYLTSVRSDKDSRVVHLEPTRHFMTFVEEWNDGILASIDAAVPGSDLVAQRAAWFDLGTQMRTRGAVGLLEGWDPLAPFPEVAHFANVDGGWMLVERIVTAALSHPDGPAIAPISIDLHRHGKDYGGSRSNLRRLLESAYQNGLLAAPPKAGGQIVPSSLLLCSFLTFIASYLGYYRQQCLAALECHSQNA